MATQQKTQFPNLHCLVLAVSTEIERGRLDTKGLAKLMSAHFGGSDATGAWSWRMAYDVMEAGFVRMIRDQREASAQSNQLDMLIHLATTLPTETRRSENQIRLQQFSTPLPYAYLAAEAANLRSTDHVLEPSAGTGALALFATNAGCAITLNELDPFRAALLHSVFDQPISHHDAEHIDDLLDPTIAPSVVLINPPFSSSASRSSDPSIAARHLVSASKRLVKGGRLVAIMPAGFSAQNQPDWWARLQKHVTPRLSILLPGQVYRKMGTSVETRLLICDKAKQGRFQCRNVRAGSLPAARDIITSEVPKRSDVSKGSTARLTLSKSALQRAKPIAQRKSTAGLAQPSTSSRSPSSPHTSSPLAPVAYRALETPRINAPVSEVYARYAPQRIEIDGAQDHPTPLVESLAMASVVPPLPQSAPSLPQKITREGLLSAAQLEAVIAANDAHAQDLPGRFVINEDHTAITRADDDPNALAYRMGSFLGDGTGCGKGRQVAALILANWIEGRTRAIWVSKSSTLIEDAIRDWKDLGGSPTDIQPLAKWKPNEAITLGSGILFVTYATLRAQGKDGSTRLQQMLDWAGADFEGVLAFDEAHAMQNAAGSSEGRGQKPSQQGLAGLRLQLAMPRARVFYVSATGATNVGNLAYASRLGLWGPGPEYPFASREQFVASMEAGGVAAMEVVARDLKAMGLYTARALSFEGVEYDILEHKLTEAQTQIYDAYAGAFRTIHANLAKALEATGLVDPDGKTQSTSAKASALSRFESTKQRFFNHLLLGMKSPSIISQIEADIAAGWAPVIQIVSTGEALLKRRLESMAPEDSLVEGALTPREYVVAYLEQAFPIHAQKLVEIDGNIIAEPLRDENGQLIISLEAMALREETIEDLMCLAPIPSALDQIIWHFGDEAIAEVTGRSIRPVRASDGQLEIQKRSASANSAETSAFMNGEKSILIFSDAGGTGRSYHAAQSAQNQKRRRHYLLEPGWRADAAIQGLGRTHRSAQVSAPFFRVCTTDVHGEKRFTSTIARRLDTLGALTKGQRETGTQGMFRAEDNLESPIARRSLRGLFADIAADRATSMSYETFMDWTALKLADKEGVLLEELPPIQRFLNRVLALPIHLQNALFGEFMERIATQTERARAAGTLDIGLETLRGDTIRQIASEDLWTCPKSAAITRIVTLEITNPVRILTAREAIGMNARLGLMTNRVSGKVALISKRPFEIYEDDCVALSRHIQRPTGSGYLEEAAFAKSNWEAIDEAGFLAGWAREAEALPKIKTERVYMLTGLLIPIWSQIPSRNERIYRVTPEGGASMIGRAIGEEQVASLRAGFMTEAPTTPAEIVTLATGSTKPIDLGKGLTLLRRRVAGQPRLEIEGADRETLQNLKAIGCFTEIIAFQLRVFVPNGEGANPEVIIARIMGQGGAEEDEAA